MILERSCHSYFADAGNPPLLVGGKSSSISSFGHSFDVVHSDNKADMLNMVSLYQGVKFLKGCFRYITDSDFHTVAVCDLLYECLGNSCLPFFNPDRENIGVQ